MKGLKRIWVIASMGVGLFCLFACLGCGGQEWSPERIERITGVKVPDYVITDTLKGRRGFNGDYTDWFDIEFKTMPTDKLFNEIDEMIATWKTGWSRDGNQYRFSVTWGNGISAPPGEYDWEDRMFSITITKGEKVGMITSGRW